MTVREQFRTMRGANWAADPRAQAELSDLVDRVIAGQEINPVEDVPPFKLIFNLPDYQTHTAVMLSMHRRLEQAVAEIEREMQRRAAMLKYCVDLLQ